MGRKVDFLFRSYNKQGLIELDDLGAESIVHKMLDALDHTNLNKAFLSQTLIGLTSEGALVMLGRKRGMAVQLQSRLTNIVVWHCSVHRLELAVGDMTRNDGC